MEWLLSLLGVLSLVATAYTMRLSPLHPDRKGKMALTPENEHMVRLRSGLLPVNGGVCLLLTAAYLLGTGETYTIRPVLYLIPGGMYVVALLLLLFHCSPSSRQPCSQPSCLPETQCSLWIFPPSRICSTSTRVHNLAPAPYCLRVSAS